MFVIALSRSNDMTKFLSPMTEENSVSKIATTAHAAVLLQRQPQTLRKWACLECGPIRPIRINGRLAWRIADIEQLLNGEA
jgi:hypothetical protein